MAPKKKAAPGANRAASDTTLDKQYPTPPTVTGRCAQVLNLIRQQQPVLSFTMTAEHAINRPAEFFEAGAKCIKQSADDLAGGMAAIAEEDKPTLRRAILRNLRNFLEFSRWCRSSASGQAGA